MSSHRRSTLARTDENLNDDSDLVKVELDRRLAAKIISVTLSLPASVLTSETLPSKSVSGPSVTRTDVPT